MHGRISSGELLEGVVIKLINRWFFTLIAISAWITKGIVSFTKQENMYMQFMYGARIENILGAKNV